jgi:hypothetical protein
VEQAETRHGQASCVLTQLGSEDHTHSPSSVDRETQGQVWEAPGQEWRTIHSCMTSTQGLHTKAGPPASVLLPVLPVRSDWDCMDQHPAWQPRELTWPEEWPRLPDCSTANLRIVCTWRATKHEEQVLHF